MLAAVFALSGATRASAQEIHDIHWVRDSAEHRALFLEVYHAATARVDQLSEDLAGGTWAVIAAQQGQCPRRRRG